MTTSPSRYAVYLAPRPETELWQLASAWLGWDASRAETVSPFELPDLPPHERGQLTTNAARYGFHGTIVAPFELADGTDEAALSGAIGRCAGEQQAFELPLELAALGAFIALRPAEPTGPLYVLHEALLEAADPHRRALGAADFERRKKGGRLTDRQLAHLSRWGYPYVLEDYRYHMTLTGSIASDAKRAGIRATLETHLAPALTEPFRVRDVCIFKQADRQEPFVILDRMPFAGA